MPVTINDLLAKEKELVQLLKQVRQAAGKRGPGRPAKSIEEHLAEGTYRNDRHGELRSTVLNYRPKPAARIIASAGSQGRWCRNEADYRAVAAGYRFNEALAEHAAEFFPSFLRHSKGSEWYGKPFDLLPWEIQDIIFPLFGWVGEDGLRRFRVSYVEIGKKNGKSELASGIGLYLLTADEEPGAEVYSLATDKDQARIVHGEAIHMVEASPDLAAILKINRTTGAILYRGTKSVYAIRSSVARGKHGVNAHGLVMDELHAWHGRALWDSIKYATRFRSQPLAMAITNAGDDPESVCFQQHRHAQQVLKGTIENHHFHAVIYSADEAEVDAEIEAVRKGATELPVARKCNPSLGTILREGRLLDDVRDAIANPAELNNLKRWTYCLWVIGRNPLFPAGAWEGCRREFSEDNLLGRPCWGAIDCSASEALSAFALLFPDDEEDDERRTYRLLLYHWLPSETARLKQHLIDYPTWARDGFLELLPNRATIDIAFVRKQILAAAERFRLLGLFYDPWHFDSEAQGLREQHGIQANKFPQNLAHFAGPMRRFRQLVADRRIHHNGNTLLAWQMGHTETYRDANGNERPVKPDPATNKHIDGVVATVMTLGGLAVAAAPQSAYRDRGVLYVEDLLREEDAEQGPENA